MRSILTLIHMAQVISGLPILISGFLPHEEGNVSFVVEGGMGSYCKDPEALTRHLGLWLSSPIELADMARASHRAGRPRASLDIARDILDILESHTACSGPEGRQADQAGRSGDSNGVVHEGTPSSKHERQRAECPIREHRLPPKKGLGAVDGLTDGEAASGGGGAPIKPSLHPVPTNTARPFGLSPSPPAPLPPGPPSSLPGSDAQSDGDDADVSAMQNESTTSTKHLLESELPYRCTSLSTLFRELLKKYKRG
jgi:hypothetical protein